jgi:hypothetical protein
MYDIRSWELMRGTLHRVFFSLTSHRVGRKPKYDLDSEGLVFEKFLILCHRIDVLGELKSPEGRTIADSSHLPEDLGSNFVSFFLGMVRALSLCTEVGRWS